MDLTPLYTNWSRFCFFLAVALFVILAIFRSDLDTVVLLIWLQVPVYFLHQFEEHAWPGGFKDFVNKTVFRIPDKDYPLNDRNIFWINVPAIWILMPISAALSHIHVELGFWVVYFSVLNALTHVAAFYKLKVYNPGLFISLVLNIPVGIYAVAKIHEAGLLTPLVTVASIAFAIFLHVLIIVYAKKRLEEYKELKSKAEKI